MLVKESKICRRETERLTGYFDANVASLEKNDKGGGNNRKKKNVVVELFKKEYDSMTEKEIFLFLNDTLSMRESREAPPNSYVTGEDATSPSENKVFFLQPNRARKRRKKVSNITKQHVRR